MAVLRSKHGNEYGMSILSTLRLCIKLKLFRMVCSRRIVFSVKIFPPLVDTKLGKKRRKRVKRIGENFKSKRRNKCSICKRIGHNITTCVNNNKS
ncbi:hypothetical protein H5410_045644 [Solanum commersonii]|uniref:Uncharacterized protein n=1 Tax=Solanum commersonii TaxID=4109 RepID=A0A9J5XBR7_SOLCO|nr:hypothetical protein H5410_045644 [Solanum commersonii]